MGRAVADWTKIKFEYIHSGIKIIDLANKYGVKEATIWKRHHRERWGDLRAEAEQKAFVDAASQKSKQRVQDLTAFNEDDLKISRAIRGRIAKRLGDTENPLTMSELRQLAATAEVAQRMGRLALGASTDNVGMGGPGGEGPVAVTNVSKEDYVAARKEILDDF